MLSSKTTHKVLMALSLSFTLLAPSQASAGDPPSHPVRPSAEARFVARGYYPESHSEIKLRVGKAFDPKLKAGKIFGKFNMEHTRFVGAGFTGEIQPDHAQFRINGLGAGRNEKNGDSLKMGASLVAIHREEAIPELSMNGLGGLAEFQKHIAGPLSVYGEGNYAGLSGALEETPGGKIIAEGYSFNTEGGLAVGFGKVKKTGEKRVSLKAGVGYQKAAFTGERTKTLEVIPGTSVVETTDIKTGRDQLTKNVTVGVVF